MDQKRRDLADKVKGMIVEAAEVSHYAAAMFCWLAAALLTEKEKELADACYPFANRNFGDNTEEEIEPTQYKM